MCDSCEREYIEYMEEQHDIDLIAAIDPEPDAVRDFAEWVEQCGE